MSLIDEDRWASPKLYGHALACLGVGGPGHKNDEAAASSPGQHVWTVLPYIGHTGPNTVLQGSLCTHS